MPPELVGSLASDNKGDFSTQPNSSKSKRVTPDGKPRLGGLFVLDLSGDQILSMSSDGSNRKVIVTGCRHPDGVVVDVETGHIYWTNMGVPNMNDGSIERADLDGRNRKIIIPEGGTFTPKQLHLDKKNGRLYWSDREGMRVMRSNLDGSDIETLVETGHGDADRRDANKWCVGITVDAERGQIYWTQKGPDDAGQGRIFRANVEIPKGQTAANRKDIDLLFDNLPEPIDLELDHHNRVLYWTDRGDPPRGNTVNRSSVDGEPKQHKPSEILITHLMEGIGITLDLRGDRMFVTDLGGSVYSAKLNGSEKRTLLYAQGNLAGIALRRNTHKGELIDVLQQTYSPNRHCWHGESCPPQAGPPSIWRAGSDVVATDPALQTRKPTYASMLTRRGRHSRPIGLSPLMQRATA